MGRPPVIRPYNGILPTLGERVYVDEQAAVIGQVQLGDDVSLWPGAVVRGDVNRIEVGARTSVQDNAVLHCTHDGPYTPGGTPLIVGADVTVGHSVNLHACTIGRFCLIGIGSIVLDRVVIEDEVMLGAGSLVPPGKRLHSGWLYVGSPAKALRKLRPEEFENLRYSPGHYVRLKDRYLNVA